MKKLKYIVKESLPLNRDVKIRLLKAIEKGKINLNDFQEFMSVIESTIEPITGMRVIDSTRGDDLF